MKRNEILEAAVEKWGIESQMFMAIEEMAELTKALSKYYRKPASNESKNILEEIADVRIMMDQMIIIFERDYHDSVENIETVKLERLEKLLNHP